MSIRYALRTLLQTPLVTGVACLSLALGIGANSAIFSLFDQVLVRPLPAAEPERLVNLSSPGPKPGSQSCGQPGGCDDVFSYPMFRDLERQQTVFTGLAAHVLFGANLAHRGRTASGEGLTVSGAYFPALGLTPALGRLLGPEDDRAVGGEPVVVLAHDYWRSAFGASPAVLGDTLTVNGQALTVVGVAPPGFSGTTLGSRPQVFVPITLREQMVPGWQVFGDRRAYWLYLFARLAPGVSLGEAETALNVPYRAILNEVEAPLQSGMSEATMARFREKSLTLSDGRRGQSSVHRAARAPLLLLFAVSGFVLLIACANVANLLLARAVARSGEIAVRLSIGAGRRRLVGQLLTEACLLGVAAGAVGVVVAYWTLEFIGSLLPAEVAADMVFTLDRRTFAFAGVLGLGTGLVFGLFPALYSTRPDLLSGLKAKAAQSSGARAAARFRSSLVTAQIALAMALLVSAGLFIKSLAQVSRVDLGIATDHLVTFGLAPGLSGYTPERSRELFERIEAELATLPGVSGAAGSMVPLIAGSSWGSSVSVEAFEAGPDSDTHANFNEVGPAFFRTLGIPLLAGRELTPADVAGAPKVAIVNEAFARKFDLGRDAVGKRMAQRTGNAVELDIEIVGLVEDAKYHEVKDAVPPQFFIPYRQDPRLGALNFYVRTDLDPEHLLASIGEVVRRADPNLPVERLQAMEAQVRENVSTDRMIGTLSAAFASLATLLAAVGLYGVLAYSVAQRTREIGLRMALGADAGRVRGMVLRQMGLMTAVGGAIGLLAALGLARLARSLLFELEGHDPTVLIGATVALVLVALTAGLVPASRASRIEPMRALRWE